MPLPAFLPPLFPLPLHRHADPTISTPRLSPRLRPRTCPCYTPSTLSPSACATAPSPPSTPLPSPSPAPLLPTPAATPPASPRDLDIVITHSTADFDSLAAAVGLAKLRGPRTVVVTPGGESPALRRFLALHRQLYQILPPSAVDPSRLRWLGVVDTVRRARLGVAADWPARAHSVSVFDHHVGHVCDITNPNLELVVAPVGAVATLICERLQAASMAMTPAEATLLALAVHSDTASLTLEHTTPRDAAALAWLMSQGAIQRSIAEFSQNMLSDEQQAILSDALRDVRRTSVAGLEMGSLFVVGRAFLKGLSAVAEDLLDIANLDVLILVYVNCRGRRAARRTTRRRVMDSDVDAGCGPDQLKQVSVIGRARARVDGIDFRELFTPLGGGGHARAASASLKATEADAEDLLHTLVQQATTQIPHPRPVSDFMTNDLVTIFPAAPLGHARRLMALHGHQILPVVDENDALLGLITIQIIKLAERKRGEDVFSTPVSAWVHQSVVTVRPDTPFYVAEKLVAENTLGMLPVVDENKMLLGAITRMDVLIARRLWPQEVETTSTPTVAAENSSPPE